MIRGAHEGIRGTDAPLFNQILQRSTVAGDSNHEKGNSWRRKPAEIIGANVYDEIRWTGTV
jgi:hypothetical protein